MKVQPSFSKIPPFKDTSSSSEKSISNYRARKAAVLFLALKVKEKPPPLLGRSSTWRDQNGYVGDKVGSLRLFSTKLSVNRISAVDTGFVLLVSCSVQYHNSGPSTQKHKLSQDFIEFSGNWFILQYGLGPIKLRGPQILDRFLTFRIYYFSWLLWTGAYTVITKINVDCMKCKRKRECIVGWNDSLFKFFCHSSRILGSAGNLKVLTFDFERLVQFVAAQNTIISALSRLENTVLNFPRFSTWDQHWRNNLFFSDNFSDHYTKIRAKK